VRVKSGFLAFAFALFVLLPASAFAHGVARGDARFLQSLHGAAIAPLMYLGAKHMVTGYDHLLFLVGVIFFLYRLKDVLLYVSLFTIGHSEEGREILLVAIADENGIRELDRLKNATAALADPRRTDPPAPWRTGGRLRSRRGNRGAARPEHATRQPHGAAGEHDDDGGTERLLEQRQPVYFEFVEAAAAGEYEGGRALAILEAIVFRLPPANSNRGPSGLPGRRTYGNRCSRRIRKITRVPRRNRPQALSPVRR
jgi:hypothetical protein